jgi:asparagine synthase (glutamine-hydrolysing)
VDEIGPHEPQQWFNIAQVWHDAAQNPQALSEAELQETVRTALLDSVRHHMVADVPVGAFLSGGIDSGALVALMTEITGRSAAPGANPFPSTGKKLTIPTPSTGKKLTIPSPLTGEGEGGGETSRIHTITLAFEEFRGRHEDEAPLAEQVARHYGTHHTTRIVTEQEFREDLPKILEAMDQPSIDGINTWFVAKAAREQGLKVAISGLGGDELFGGYPSFKDIPRWVRTFALPSRIPFLGDIFRVVYQSLVIGHRSPKAAGLVKYGGTYVGAYLLKRGLFLPWELPQLLGQELAREGLRRLQPKKLIEAAMSPTPLNSYPKIAAIEASLYMRNQLLRDSDWAGMAHSLEIRVPLVDVTLLRSLAPALVRQPQHNGKRLLANSPTRDLPSEITNRAKSGFTAPVDRWLHRTETQNGWRNVPQLARTGCPWARRWAYNVGVQLAA